MDIASIFLSQDTPAIVVWFALMVVVFAVFIGLGIYQGRRTEEREREAAEARAARLPPPGKAARPSRPPPSHHTNTHRKEYI